MFKFISTSYANLLRWLHVEQQPSLPELTQGLVPRGLAGLDEEIIVNPRDHAKVGKFENLAGDIIHLSITL